ncbi:MAG: hypothetical protein WC850_04840 [Candidatus Gracilibacteria bacterium]
MQTNNQNKLFFYSLILLSLFILIFFTKDLYFSVLKNMDLFETKQTEYKTQGETLKKLQDIEKNLGKDLKMNKYLKEVKEDELIEYFYGFVNNNRSGSGYTIIDSINIEKGTKNEYGFNESKINLIITVSDEQEMFKMLDFITSEESSYQFFIDNFSFPNDTDNKGGFQVTIPIRMFYK